MFSVDVFEAAWPELAKSLRYFAEVDSTNDTARLFEREDGAIILSERQRKGRGRSGSSWYSEENHSLTLTLVAHSTLPLQQRSRLALGAGLAVAQTIEQYGNILAEVKWPNDVFVNGAKICGILVEASTHGAIVGIGCNIGKLTSAPTMERQATSLSEESTQVIDRESFLGALVKRCRYIFQQCETDFPNVVDALNQRLAWKGQAITFADDFGDTKRGVIHEIAHDGALEIEISGIKKRIYSASEIKVVDA